ncbi:hypothetical protein DIPPA_58214, partial [Diplonema papillatum]
MLFLFAVLTTSLSSWSSRGRHDKYHGAPGFKTRSSGRKTSANPTPPPPPSPPVRFCFFDSQCGADQWCRRSKATSGRCTWARYCTPKVGAGATCTGFNTTCEQEVCRSGLECVGENIAADVKGTCQAPAGSGAT